MVDDMSELTILEKQSNIKLSRSTKNLYSWEIKLYFDETKETPEKATQKIEELNNLLKNKFLGVPIEEKN